MQLLVSQRREVEDRDAPDGLKCLVISPAGERTRPKRGGHGPSGMSGE